jgi:2-amino-4-hydroxy-6-hydroxymethyldihydropteridine diphosphokinase
MDNAILPEDQPVQVYLSLGSNLGDRKANLGAIRSALPPEVVVREASSIYETEPWGYLQQPDFLNQILLVETHLSARDLLAYLKDLEKWIGREPSVRFGPRLVDIDIIFYDDQVIVEPGLEIPHPRFKDRAFVLVPLAEISPNYPIPGTDETIADVLENLDTSGVLPYQE